MGLRDLSVFERAMSVAPKKNGLTDSGIAFGPLLPVNLPMTLDKCLWRSDPGVLTSGRRCSGVRPEMPAALDLGNALSAFLISPFVAGAGV
jgi:hypothetical protein